MKRILTALVALLYLATSTGATVRFHYCMGKLADWGFGHSYSKLCGECGMVESMNKSDCCKDEHTFIKNDADQKTVESSFQLVKLVTTAPLIDQAEISIAQIFSVTEETPVSNAPPRSCSVAVYLFNRTLLI